MADQDPRGTVLYLRIADTTLRVALVRNQDPRAKLLRIATRKDGFEGLDYRGAGALLAVALFTRRTMQQNRRRYRFHTTIPKNVRLTQPVRVLLGKMERAYRSSADSIGEDL